MLFDTWHQGGSAKPASARAAQLLEPLAEVLALVCQHAHGHHLASIFTHGAACARTLPTYSGGDPCPSQRMNTPRPAEIRRARHGRAPRPRSALAELPDIPGVRERWGRDLLHCPYCHGWEVRDQPLGVLGTIPGSVQHALLVRQWSDDVIFFAHTYDLTPGELDQLHARGVQIVHGTITQLEVDADLLTGVALADGRLIRALPCSSDLGSCPTPMVSSALLVATSTTPASRSSIQPAEPPRRECGPQGTQPMRVPR
ncbi:MAG: hypothetical protein WKF58_00030 [Ilumatobacteraceae bacterium]